MIATDDGKQNVGAFGHKYPLSILKMSCIVRDILELTAYELTL